MTVYIVVYVDNADTTHPNTQIAQVYASRDRANARAQQIAGQYTVATVIPREVILYA